MDPSFTIDDEGHSRSSELTQHDEEQPSTSSQTIVSVDLKNDDTTKTKPTTFKVTNGAVYTPQKPDSFQMVVAGKKVQVEYKILPIIAQYVAAMIILIAITSKNNRVTNYTYGIIFSSVSMALCLIGTICHYTVSRSMENRLPGSSMILQSLTYSAALSIFLWLWWLVGVVILTFFGPFLVSSNGYFACWAGLVCATKALFNDLDSTGWIDGLLYGTELYKDVFFGALVVLLFALPRAIGKNSDESNVSQIYGVDDDGNTKSYQNEAIFSLVIVIITFPILVISRFGWAPQRVVAHQCFESILLSLWGILAILWLVMACLVTFRGPFGQTGNGYFASWAGLVCCLTVALRTSDPTFLDHSQQQHNRRNNQRIEPSPANTELGEVTNFYRSNPPSTSNSYSIESNSRGTTIVAPPTFRMPRLPSTTTRSSQSIGAKSQSNMYNGPAEV